MCLSALQVVADEKRGVDHKSVGAVIIFPERAR